MKTRIKTLAILATVAAVTFAASAQVRERTERPNRKPDGFQCPTCGSPCISKAAIMKHRRQRMQANARHQSGPNRPADARHRANYRNRGPQQQSPARFRHNQQQQPSSPEINRKNRWQRAMQFDIDGDGQLSQAERTALKAYRTAIRQQRDEAPANRPEPQSPVAE